MVSASRSTVTSSQGTTGWRCPVRASPSPAGSGLRTGGSSRVGHARERGTRSPAVIKNCTGRARAGRTILTCRQQKQRQEAPQQEQHRAFGAVCLCSCYPRSPAHGDNSHCHSLRAQSKLCHSASDAACWRAVLLQHHGADYACASLVLVMGIVRPTGHCRTLAC